MRLLEASLCAALISCGPETLAPGSPPRPTASRSDELRPDSPNTTEPAPTFGASDVVERFGVPDASVVVHYTRMGTHRVPPGDSDDSGVPDFVESVGATYRDVLDAYHVTWGFKRPPTDALVPGDNGGDDRFDVYLVDFTQGADGAFRQECLASDPLHCPGYLVQENDFAGFGYPTALDGIVTVSSHEYFHGVQAGYSSRQGVNLTEGTAVWATERFAPRLNDFEGFARGYLMTPDRSLDQEPSSPVDSYSYGLGLFFECLTAQRGDDAVRDLWERIDGGTGWLGTLERNLAEDGGSLSLVMERCSDFNVFTGSRARIGYGHARAAQLPLATVTETSQQVMVPRSRMFRASSRYWHVTSLPADAVVWWKAAADAPAGGPATIRVRFARDVAGAPQLVAVPEGSPVALGAGAAFVLVSNVATGGASVPVGVCAGSPSFVDGCRAVDAGVDAGEPPDAGEPADAGMNPIDPPKGCGCNGGTGPLLLLALLLLARSVRAQTVADPDAGTPERELVTVVTAGRLAQQLKDTTVAVEVVTKRQIQETGARDLAEALQARPGLETTPNVGQTGLRIGGLGPEYNLILVDGQRIAGRIAGGVDLSRLNVENIEQIEIVKGPSSVLWGSEALAGTVNIITRRPSKPLGGSATASYGTLNQVSATAGGEASGDGWGVLATGGWERRDPYDYDRETAATSGSSLDQGQGSVKAVWGRGKDEPSLDLRLDLSRRVQHGVDEGGSGLIHDRSSRDNVIQGRFGARVPAGNGEVAVSTSASWFDRRFILDQRGATALDSVEDSRETTAQLDAYASQTIFSTHTVLGGGQALVELYDSPRLGTGHGQRFRGGLFAQERWVPQVRRAVFVEAGARVDFDSFFGSAVTPRLSLRFDPVPNLQLRVNTGSGFRAPSFQELFLDFENPSVGYEVLGNSRLQPERSWGTAVGAQWAPGRWLFSLGLFWNELWQMINIVEAPMGSASEQQVFQYQNVARARSLGFELSAGVTIFEGLTAEGGYTFTDARDLTAGLSLENQSQHRGYGQVRWRLRDWGLTTLVRCSVTGPRAVYVAETATTAVTWENPFALLDVRVAKSFGSHVEVFAAGMNLLGAGKVDLPIPPRSLFAGVTVRD